MNPDGSSPSLPQRGWRVMRKQIRSTLRRYPRELLASLRRRDVREEIAAHSLAHIEEHELAAIWLGHASALVRLGGVNLLVDPVFSDRIGLKLGKKIFGPKRICDPPASVEDLPPIDLIFITHAHFDHLDRPTLRQLARPETTVITPHGTRRLIPHGFGAVLELSGGQRTNVYGLDVRTVQPAHYGRRKLLDWHRRVNSYFVRSTSGRVFLAGDTAFTHAFSQLEGAELAVFGIGAYDPREHAHATPEQVWCMFCDLDARWLLPVHHSTFELSDEPVDEPMCRLLAAAAEHEQQVVRVQPGELWVCPERGWG